MMGNSMDEGVIYADGVGGGGGIRTHGSCYTPPVFKTGAIDHSATPPLSAYLYSTKDSPVIGSRTG